MLFLALPILPGCAEDLEFDEAELACYGPRGLAAKVRRAAAAAGVTRLPPAPVVQPELFALGQALAFDKILSGPRDVSCMSCHHPTMATSDTRHVTIGTGGVGLGPDRVHPDGVFVGRNTQPLFNLHAMPVMLWDARVANVDGALRLPPGITLAPGMADALGRGAAAAVAMQAMLPVNSRAEMRGHGSDDVGAVADGNPQQVWAALMARLGTIPEYRAMFAAAFPGKRFEDLNFAHAASAIAAFEITAFVSDGSPWDRFLAGDDRALTTRQLKGAEAFFGKGRCAACHDGPAFTDLKAHGTGLPQVGPGVGHGEGGHDDFGAGGATGRLGDRYKFRTPSLRNVLLTGPWGHAGQLTELRDVVDHYRDPARALRDYDPGQLEPVLQDSVQPTRTAVLAAVDPEIRRVRLNSREVDDIVLFLDALTDPDALDLEHTIPARVPSGLPVAD